MKIREEDMSTYNALLQGECPEQVIYRAKNVLLCQLRARRVEETAFSKPSIVRDFLLLELAGRKHEVFAVMFLDSRHRLLEYREMFTGTINSASVYPREVAKAALEANAAAVILAHNHPAGDPDPSDADRRITQRLQEALGLFDISVLDHIVVGESTVSFAERGYM